MVMRRCDNGHFYDSSKYQQCPYCGFSDMDVAKTMPIVQDRPADMPVGGGVGKTVAVAGDFPSTVAPGMGDDAKTVSLYQRKKGINPVVGWVVCVEGESKGQDYRIKPERNFIGRDSSMDISIPGDSSISRDKHAAISYSARNNSFILTPGDGRGLVYLNDEALYTPMELHKGDIIELGETKLMFIPMCGEDFQW